MARRPTFSGSGRSSARGFAPARTPAASLAGTPDSPIRSAEPLAAARSSALSLLSRRDYTTHELRTKLTDRGYDDAAIGPLIESLTGSGLLDDRRVAGAHVRTASRVKSRGRLRIARELSARGISRALITEALGSLEASDEVAAIRKILARKKWPVNPAPAERRRMFAHLMRRGFTGDAVRRALGGGADED